MLPKELKEFWGSLIRPEHPPQPTPLFRNLLHAIADYAIKNLEPKNIRELTPEKMSALYHAMDGDPNLDELFLNTPSAQLSGIYSTLGCSHSLQPVPGDDFLPPSIPALTPRGFTIWQTVQLLLDPVEHVPYIRTAVQKFSLINPETGEHFPRAIPPECFPSEPDQETIQWHDEMFERKRKLDEAAAAEAARESARAAPPHPPDASLDPGLHANGGISAEDEEFLRYRTGHGSGGGHRRKHRSRSSKKAAPLYPDPPSPEPYHASSSPEDHRHRHSHRRSGTHSYPESGSVRARRTPCSSEDEAEAYGSPAGHSKHRGTSHSHSRSRRGATSYIYANGSSMPIYSPDTSPETIPTGLASPPPLSTYRSYPHMRDQRDRDGLYDELHGRGRSTSPIRPPPPPLAHGHPPTSYPRAYYDEPLDTDDESEDFLGAGVGVGGGIPGGWREDDVDRDRDRVRRRDEDLLERRSRRRAAQAAREREAEYVGHAPHGGIGGMAGGGMAGLAGGGGGGSSARYRHIGPGIATGGRAGRIYYY